MVSHMRTKASCDVLSQGTNAPAGKVQRGFLMKDVLLFFRSTGVKGAMAAAMVAHGGIFVTASEIFLCLLCAVASADHRSTK